MSFKPIYGISPQNAKEVDILLYGVIGDSYWDDGNSGKRFVADFTALEKKYDRINIRINSPGGSVWDGLAMFNAIKASKKDTHTFIDGIAFSMGAMIALAGKTVHAAKGSLFLLHNVSGGAMGNARDMRKQADEMDTYDEVLGELIADKCGKTMAQVKKDWMNYEDNLMTASKAFDAKLVDVLETYDAKEVPENIKDLTMDQLVAYYQPDKIVPPNSAAKPAALNPLNQSINMLGFNKFKSLSALVGKPAAEITAALVEAANLELVAENVPGVTLVLDSALQTVNDAAIAASNGLTAINAVLGAANAKTTLPEAITALIASATTTAATLATVTAERDAAKVLAAKYGSQPGAAPTTAKVETPEGGIVVETGAITTEEPTIGKTSYDAEVKNRGTLKTIGQLFNF